jgi:hypothetical protein
MVIDMKRVKESEKRLMKSYEGRVRLKELSMKVIG